MQKKILIADDEEHVLEVLNARLSSAGYDVYPVLNNFDVLIKSKTIKPDLIIIDIMMPELDGIKTCELLKDDEETKNIPILILSAKTINITNEFKNIANAYIKKPYDYKELAKTIETLLNKQSEI